MGDVSGSPSQQKPEVGRTGVLLVRWLRADCEGRSATYRLTRLRIGSRQQGEFGLHS